MNGLHLVADLAGCPPTLEVMIQPEALRALCLEAVRAAGLTPVAELFHRFNAPVQGEGPPGITGVVLLAESHLAVHTWPERGGVTLDAYVCNLSGDNSARAQRLIDTLADAFRPQGMRQQQLLREPPGL